MAAAARTATKPPRSGLKKKPLSATDFKPAFQGRPVLDGYMLSVPVSGDENVDIAAAGDKELVQTMNDVIANQPALPKLSAREKH
ncbi:MAG: hypothetical protein JNL83_24300 [Myxococcales bacterium]|nr:hypothetical protein [Myxococcales bacterium]